MDFPRPISFYVRVRGLHREITLVTELYWEFWLMRSSTDLKPSGYLRSRNSGYTRYIHKNISLGTDCLLWHDFSLVRSAISSELRSCNTVSCSWDLNCTRQIFMFFSFFFELYMNITPGKRLLTYVVASLSLVNSSRIHKNIYCLQELVPYR